jgi:nucleoid-associated protein YgaU
MYLDSGGVPGEQQQQTQALFILNILFGVVTIVMDLLVLCVRRGVLVELPDQASIAAGEGRRASLQVEMEAVYGGDNGHLTAGANPMHMAGTNPLHTAAIEELQASKATIEASKATIEASKATIEASKATIEAQRKEIAQLKQQQLLRGQVLGANL